MTADSLIVALIGALASVLASYVLVRQTNHERALEDAKWHGEVQTRLDALTDDSKWWRQIQSKVDTLWALMYRKAVLEGMATGILTKESPIHPNIDAFRAEPGFLEKLRNFYVEEGKELSDLELLVEIEKRFSVELAQFEVHHNLKNGASLAAACYLLRPEMKLFDHESVQEWNKKGDDA